MHTVIPHIRCLLSRYCGIGKSICSARFHTNLAASSVEMCDSDTFVMDQIDLAETANPTEITTRTPQAHTAQTDTELPRSERAQMLYDLLHPKPEHYLFNGLLVPPPPYAFGELTEESRAISDRMLVRPQYRLAAQSDMSSYHFELSDLYLEIAFAGRANCGKSSLLSALLSQPKLCRSTNGPNPNRRISYYQSISTKDLISHTLRNVNKLVKLPGGGLQFTFVDLPGWGLDGMKPSWTEQAVQCNQSYMGTRRSLNTLFYCKDATQDWNPTDDKYFDMMQNSHGTFFVVLTKCDAVSHAALCDRMARFYAMITKKKRVHRAYPLIVPTSCAMDGPHHSSIDFLRRLIVETSGVIHGAKLRRLAMEERGARMQAALASRRERCARVYFSREKNTEAILSSADSSAGQLKRLEPLQDSSELCYAHSQHKRSGTTHSKSMHRPSVELQSMTYLRNVHQRLQPEGEIRATDDSLRERWDMKYADKGIMHTSDRPKAENTKEWHVPPMIRDQAGQQGWQGHIPQRAIDKHHSASAAAQLHANTKDKMYREGVREVNPDGSLNGCFVSGSNVSSEKYLRKSPPRGAKNLKASTSRMSVRQRKAYKKFAGSTLQGRAWDAYVSTKRPQAIPHPDADSEENNKAPQSQIAYKESKVSWKAQPPGLAHNYGSMPYQRLGSSVIGV